MTTRQHMAQQTRRFNEWQERGNRAAGMHRVEDAIIEGQNAAIEQRFAVTAEHDKPMARAGTSYRHAHVVYYVGGDGRGYRVFVGHGHTRALAQDDAAAQAHEWIGAVK